MGAVVDFSSVFAVTFADRSLIPAPALTSEEAALRAPFRAL